MKSRFHHKRSQPKKFSDSKEALQINKNKRASTNEFIHLSIINKTQPSEYWTGES